MEFEDFEEVFGAKSHIAYDQQTLNHIIHCRRSLENQLFVDRLLEALGIEHASKIYPPRSHQDLRALHKRIISSESPDHYKQSLLYYLLKEIPHKGPKAAEKFAKQSYLPEKYRIFVDGIWHMDRLEFENALDFLTEPTLIPTYPEEILYALCRHTPENDSTLPLAYYYTVSPPLTSNKVLEKFFLILCRTSVTEAFFFARSRGETAHQSLFEKLITFALADTTGPLRGARSTELISLPFDKVEEAWFEEYLGSGKGGRLFGASDTLIMRGLTTGKVESLTEAKNMKGRKIDGLDWEMLRSGIANSARANASSGDVFMS